MVKPDSLDMRGYFKVLCEWALFQWAFHAALLQLDHCIASRYFSLAVLNLFCKSIIPQVFAHAIVMHNRLDRA